MSDRVTYEPRIGAESTVELRAVAAPGEDTKFQYRAKGSSDPWQTLAPDDPRVPEVLAAAGWQRRAES